MDDQRPADKARGEMSSSEARLEAVLESISDGFYALDREWRYVLFNRAAEQYFGVSADLLLGKVMWEVFPQGLGTDFERYCRGAMDEGLTTRFETASRLRPDRTVELKIAPMRNDGICVSLTDITERKRADARAVEILESIRDAFYAVDREFRFTYVNRQAETWWGQPRESLIGKAFLEVFPQAARSPAWLAHEQAAAEGRAVKVEAMSPILNRWMDVTVFPTSDGGLSVYFRDISARKRNEAARDLLIREVDHRARNMLTVVQSIVQLTRAEDIPAYKETVIGRISALARAQGSLAERRWEGAVLTDLVTEELVTVGKPHAYSLQGPEVILNPERVQPLSMIFHELATNASKYGAFSTEAGHVSVTWQVGPGGALELVWRETGGPTTGEPSRRGFGSRLITDLLRQVGGEGRFAWDATGLTARLSVPG